MSDSENGQEALPDEIELAEAMKLELFRKERQTLELQEQNIQLQKALVHSAAEKYIGELAVKYKFDPANTRINERQIIRISEDVQM